MTVVDRAAVELGAWRQVARRALVEYTAYAESGEGTPADGQRQPKAWWAGKLAAVLGGLLDAREGDPTAPPPPTPTARRPGAAQVNGTAEPETVTQLMGFVQRERRGGRRVSLDALARLFGAEVVDEAARHGWLLDLGDGRVAPSAGWLDLHR